MINWRAFPAFVVACLFAAVFGVWLTRGAVSSTADPTVTPTVVATRPAPLTPKYGPIIVVTPTVAPATPTTRATFAIQRGPYTDIICGAFPDDCAFAVSVAGCESNFSPGEVGARGEIGLFQIMPGWAEYFGYSPDALYDPATNAHIAALIVVSRGGSWRDWTCAN